jgi:hypothetical protein
VNVGGVGAEGVFKESGVMPTDAKDKEVAGVADDRVFQFVVMDLCKELVGEGEVELVFACFGKGGGEGLRLVREKALEFIHDQVEGGASFERGVSLSGRNGEIFNVKELHLTAQ